MRIAYIVRLAGIGGGETGLINLIKHLNNKNFEKYVVCPRYSSFTRVIENYAKITGIPFGHPFRDMYGNIFKMILVVFTFYKFLRKNRIDLIHTNDPVSTLFSAPVAKLLHIPVVMTSHGWWDSTPTMNRFYSRFVNKILCVSEFVKGSYLKNRTGYKLPLEVVYLGVDINKFRSDINTDYLTKEFGFNKTNRIISIIGRFQKIKGHRYFLEAAEIILKKKQDVKFLIIGSNQFNIRDDKINFQQILKKVKGSEVLRNHVILTGFRTDIPELINFSDIVICSSLCETFGMAIIEAMACGKPVISTDVGAPREIIEDDISGYLVPTSDTQSTAEKIILLLGNPTLCKNIGREATKRIEEKFSLDGYAKRIRNIYLNLIQQRNSLSNLCKNV